MTPKLTLHVYSKCEPKGEWYVIFKMSRLELCLSVLKIPIALFNFILTLDNCLVHCKCSSSRSTPSYLTDWTGISCFPSSLNLIEGSISRLVGQNISSIFWMFRYNLLALNQYDRFNRSLFICFAKTSKDIFDCIMFVSSAKWYVFKNYMQVFKSLM